jgi:hypothetical protein
VTITPDTKDWTWVLEQPCPECGFDPQDYPRDALAAKVRENARQWAAVLAGEHLEVRPSEDVWSPLEYGCHVRDVYRIMDGRLALLLSEDDPVFQNWDQDETALEERYDLQNPRIVAGELDDAAATYAERLDAVAPTQWERTGTRSNGSPFTVATLGTYSLHDVVHHLWDVSSSPSSSAPSTPDA